MLLVLVILLLSIVRSLILKFSIVVVTPLCVRLLLLVILPSASVKRTWVDVNVPKRKLGTTTVPVPSGSSVMFSLLTVLLILLPLNDKLPIPKEVAPVTLAALIVSAYTVAHLRDRLPMLYVLSAFGIRLLVRSALTVMLSVSASPIVILPPSVIFPLKSPSLA